MIAFLLFLATPQGACVGGALETVGDGAPGVGGVPVLAAVGAPLAGLHVHLEVSHAAPLAPALLLVSPAESPWFVPTFGVTLYPGAPLSLLPFGIDANGSSQPLAVLDPVAPELCGLFLVLQAAVVDSGALGGVSFTRALRATFGPEPLGPRFPSAAYPHGGSTADLTAADLDQDGFVDMIAVADDATVLLGEGDGTFAPGPITPLDDVIRGTVADMNGDGALDAVYLNYDGGYAAVRLGLDATFGPALIQGGVTRPWDLAVADFDLDGARDVAFTTTLAGLPGDHTYGVLLGKGDGTLAPPLTATLPSKADFAIAADANGDALPDLLAWGVGCCGELHVLLGAGDGTFSSAAELSIDSLRLVPGDVDGDGDLDLLVDDGMWFEGNGDGAFSPATWLPGVAAGIDPLLFDDLDADGLADLVGHDPACDCLPIYHGLGAGAFGHAQDVLTTIYSAQALLADLNGDKVRELLVGTGGVGLHVQAGRPDGTFLGIKKPELGVDEVHAIEVLDWNGDAEPDLVFTHDGPASLQFFAGAGDGELAPLQSYVVGSSASLAIADLDADGSLDLALADGFVYVCLGDGSGGLQPPSAILGEGPSGDGARDARIADLDADGALDLLAANETGDELGVWLGNGDGSFQPSLHAPAGIQPEQVVAGDLDGDGTLDAVSFNLYSATMLLGNGDGTFASAVEWSLGDFIYDGAVADLDLDGNLDVAIPTFWTPAVALAFGQGGGAFAQTSVQLMEHYSGATLLDVGDLDANGAPDLVVADSSVVHVIPNHRDGTFGPAAAHLGAFAPNDVLLADLDGDFQPEVLISGLLGVHVLANLLLGE